MHDRGQVLILIYNPADIEDVVDAAVEELPPRRPDVKYYYYMLGIDNRADNATIIKQFKYIN